MSRRVQRVAYHLDTKGIRFLPPAEVRMILRGADDLIMRGGRHLLTLILKGSARKEVLTRSLDLSPAHGFYRNLSAEEVLARVDWVIRHGYLAIEYDYRLPLLVYTPKGWSIEKETMADEHLRHIDQALKIKPAAARHERSQGPEPRGDLAAAREDRGQRRSPLHSRPRGLGADRLQEGAGANPERDPELARRE